MAQDQSRRRFTEHTGNLVVLSLVGAGLITILLSIIAGLFLAKKSAELPNWAENVLVSIATASALKLGDVLSVLAALATGRQVATLGQQITGAIEPTAKPPLDLAGAEAPETKEKP